MFELYHPFKGFIICPDINKVLIIWPNTTKQI